MVRDLDCKRFGVHLWIIEGHLVVQVPEIAAAEALRDPQRLAVWVARVIEGCFVVEAGGLHDKGVALPPPNRIAQKRRQVKLLGKLAAIGEDLAMQVAYL